MLNAALPIDDVNIDPTRQDQLVPVASVANGVFSLVQIYPVNIMDGLVRMNNATILIGRDASNELVLNDASVSRLHAKIEQIDGAFFIVDCGSTNGTFVEDTCIQKQRLNGGETIRLGSHIFKFLSNGIEVQYHSTVYNAMTRDGLTKAYNKSYMYDALAHEMARSRRSKCPVSLLLLDVDHFKKINDQYGHLAGDEVLREFCQRLQAAVRADSLVCRYGGEEFAIILGGTSLEEARDIAERCRVAVSLSPIQTHAGSIPTTISIGVAEFLNESEQFSPEDLLKLADEKLYEAKRTGRNRVC